MRNLKTKGNESELKPLIKSAEKAVPRIRRLPTKLLTEDGNQQQIKESGESSKQPIKESGEPSKQPIKEWSDSSSIKLDESHPRFGPLYTVKQEQVDAIKDKAWKHVLKKKEKDDMDKAEKQKAHMFFNQELMYAINDRARIEKKMDEPKGKEIYTNTNTNTAKKKAWEQELPEKEEERETMEIYLAAMRQVEQEAKNMYSGKVSGIGSEFRWMMIKDGCLFLQLALLLLGCSKQLGYPPNDLVFGKVQTKKEVKKVIEAMFCVGNQIPLVVLRKLMDQEFFQNVIAEAKWDPPPSGLCKKVLYQMLVLPARGRNQENVVFLGRGNDDAEQQQLCDLLHGCQNLVFGPATQDQHEAADDQIDLEANEDEAVVYEGTPDDQETTDIGNQIRTILNGMGFPNTVENRKRIFPSATELKRRAIRIKKLKSGGVRDIRFKSNYFWAYLYLPALPVDDNAEVILRNLRNYNFQQSRQNGWEVSSYLTLMSDLIQTTRDAILLQHKGIIQGESDDVEKLPAMLNRLSSEDIRLTQKLRILRSQIRDYSSPLIHYKGIINLVVFLTLLQTLFALLAYFRPPNSK